MSTIPINLEQLRDELAHKFCATLKHGQDAHMLAVQFGFNALHSHLTDAAGEFDEKSAQAEADSAMENLGPTMFTRDECAAEMVSHARWQFEQDRARIGLAELYKQITLDDEVRIKQLEAELAMKQLMYNEECKKFQAETLISWNYSQKLQVAEARLAESERRAEDRLKANMLAQDIINEQRNKLTASEARLANALEENEALRAHIKDLEST